MKKTGANFNPKKCSECSSRFTCLTDNKIKKVLGVELNPAPRCGCCKHFIKSKAYAGTAKAGICSLRNVVAGVDATCSLWVSVDNKQKAYIKNAIHKYISRHSVCIVDELADVPKEN
jgi:hypothetical protein